MNLPSGTDVVVIGGGIVGAATAAEIARRGADVVLLEKESHPAAEGSGRAQGSLRVQGRHASELPLALRSLDLWKEAAAEADLEFAAGGNLYFQTRPEEASVLAALTREAVDAGLHGVELLDPAAVREILPAATGEFLGAMWSPVDAQVQPALGTAHFAERARSRGATVAYNTKVTGILTAGDRVTGVDTAFGPIRASAVVVAAGVWTPYLTSPVGVEPPIMPVTMSELETEALPPLFPQTIRAFGFGARQRTSGGMVVSAGLNARVSHRVSLSDFSGVRFWLSRAMSFRNSISLRLDVQRVWEQLRARAILAPSLIPDRSPEPDCDKALVDSSLTRMGMVIPAVRGASVRRYWGGLVDMTPDGLPIIDGSAGPDGLTLITGLCGHGLHLGPALGEVAADLALNGGTDWQIAPFRMSRFGEGKLPMPEMTI